VRAVPDPEDTGARRRHREQPDTDPDRTGSRRRKRAKSTPEWHDDSPPAGRRTGRDDRDGAGLRAVESADDPAGEFDDDYADEPALILQWGIFVLQTIFGAAAGLGVWLGFHVLWDKYPLYAPVGVGAAVTVMLVVARWLRRRYGHDLDLLTSIIVVGVGVVLTVLPAAFSLQSR
jgi:hypothetical protein